MTSTSICCQHLLGSPSLMGVGAHLLVFVGQRLALKPVKLYCGLDQDRRVAVVP
jgi:hypothetical protein